MRKLLLILCLFLPIRVFAENKTGALTASAASCSKTNGVAMDLGSGDATAVIQLSGTFVGTVTFTLSSNGGGSYTAANGIPATLGASTSTATATGAWTFDVAGKTNICAYFSAYTSGTANVGINSSSARAMFTGTVTPQSLATTASPTFSTLKLDGTTADANVGTFSPTDPTAARTWTVPDSTFTVGQVEAVYSSDDTAAATDRVFFVATRAYKLTACSQVHAVAAGGASKLQVVKDTSTDAPGAGTDLLTNNTNTGFDLNATANTVQVGTLTATAASLALATGDRLSVDFANTIQASVGIIVTCSLIPN